MPRSLLLTPPEATTDQRAAWDAWLADRPPRVRELGARFTPFAAYRLKSTGPDVRAVIVGVDVIEDA